MTSRTRRLDLFLRLLTRNYIKLVVAAVVYTKKDQSIRKTDSPEFVVFCENIKDDSSASNTVDRSNVHLNRCLVTEP